MIALMAALGLGTKQLVRPLVSLITIPLLIPGGALAGGFYMLWLILTKRFVPKFGSGIFFGLVQALVVIPGLAADIIEIIFRKMKSKWLTSMIEGALANLVGTIAVSSIIFELSVEVLLFVSLLALFSGNIGGIIAYLIITQIKDPLIRESIIENPSLQREKEKLPERKRNYLTMR